MHHSVLVSFLQTFKVLTCGLLLSVVLVLRPPAPLQLRAVRRERPVNEARLELGAVADGDAIETDAPLDVLAVLMNALQLLPGQNQCYYSSHKPLFLDEHLHSVHLGRPRDQEPSLGKNRVILCDEHGCRHQFIILHFVCVREKLSGLDEVVQEPNSYLLVLYKFFLRQACERTQAVSAVV